MARKRYKPEEIVARLRQVEVLTAQGKTAVEAIRSISARSYSSEAGGLYGEPQKALPALS